MIACRAAAAELHHCSYRSDSVAKSVSVFANNLRVSPIKEKPKRCYTRKSIDQLKSLINQCSRSSAVAEKPRDAP